MAPKDLALRRSDQRLAPISAYRRPFSPILKVASLSTVGAQNWSACTLPEMVQTIVPKDFTQYCSSPPLCTMISYGYTLSLGRIFCLKIIRGFVDYGQNLFKLSISGLNILSKITKDTTSDRRDFFSERILKYWNILPKNVKMSESVNSFKANLENYKVRSLANGNAFHNSTGHFWDVSGHIMDRIENPSYLAGRPAFREYLISNPWIAKRKKINTFQSQ